MVLRRRAVLGLGLVLFALTVGSADAADPGPPADGPDLSTMALAKADFGAGGDVSDGKWFASGSIPVYYARNGPGTIGSTVLLYSTNVLLALADAVQASADITTTRRSLSTAAQRAAYVKNFVKLPAARGKHTKLVVGALHSLAAGDEGLQFGVTYVTGKLRTSALAEFVRVDRVEGFVLSVSFSGAAVPPAVGKAEALAIATRMRAGLAVAAVGAPAITGTAQQGQTLNADHGHWAGGPSAFVFQWSRCDVTGANCATIAGATQPSYTPGSADAGSTLVVTVTGSNTVGQMTSTSTPTAPIS
jgi:hypothetical protein